VQILRLVKIIAVASKEERFWRLQECIARSNRPFKDGDVWASSFLCLSFVPQNLFNEWNGQFFTPDSISRFMAEILQIPEDIPEGKGTSQSMNQPVVPAP